MTTPTYGPDS